ncbi:MAG: ATPase [Flavobacterium sp. BFFFF1]|uniref:SRPBCC family protein n=1 Tax=Flavobacterium sp. BFFFF1 TaxID=2015557 RepID=UPI000BC6F0C7|nr:SRPBCC domain-containing protein [Flavobacterium sp. BFFFF1]OYU79231.1 MAG: ATPase [Flavobacterium sp. BFFFF1]
MKNLAMDFSVDKENNKIHVKREFAAYVNNVWDAWTKAELLDQWWAPKPYIAKTRSMDFSEGGTWFYAMIGPQGEEHRCRADYQTISPQQSFTGLDAFCDEHWNTNTDFPRTKWDVAFHQDGEYTVVEVVMTYEKLSDLEMIIQMGFKEGFTMALGNLDELLAQHDLK